MKVKTDGLNFKLFNQLTLKDRSAEIQFISDLFLEKLKKDKRIDGAPKKRFLEYYRNKNLLNSFSYQDIVNSFKKKKEKVPSYIIYLGLMGCIPSQKKFTFQANKMHKGQIVFAIPLLKESHQSYLSRDFIDCYFKKLSKEEISFIANLENELAVYSKDKGSIFESLLRNANLNSQILDDDILEKVSDFLKSEYFILNNVFFKKELHQGIDLQSRLKMCNKNIQDVGGFTNVKRASRAAI